jgi:hypothetical protein
LIWQAAKIAYWMEPIGLVLVSLLIRLVFDRSPEFFAVAYAVLLATVGYDVATQARDYLEDTTSRKRDVGSEPPEALFRFSANRPNILLFVPDAGAITVLPELMAEDDRSARFDGFVHYRNTLSVGSYTMTSTAALIGGDRHLPARINEQNDRTITAHIEEAYDWLAASLGQHDYESTFVNPGFIDCADIEQADRCVQSARFKQALEQRHGFEALEIFDEETVLYFAAFKVLPYSLKLRLYLSQGWEDALDSSGPLESSDTLLQNSDVAAIICSALGGCEGIKPDPIRHPIPNRTARYFVTKHGNELFARASRRFQVVQVIEVQGNVNEHPDLQ